MSQSPASPSKAFVYPYKVSGRSSFATIYSSSHRDKILFQIVYYVGTERKIKNCSNEKKAHEQAAQIVAKLDKGLGQTLELSAADKESYQAALQSLAPFKLPLHSAISDYVEALKLLKGRALLPAVRFYLKSEAEKLPSCTVPELFAKFMAAKEADGVSTRHLNDCRSRLGRFSRDFTGEVINIKTDELNTWLRGLGNSIRDRNNFRTLIVGLFNFAKANGFLPKHQETEADWTAIGREQDKEIITFTNEEMRKLLKFATEKTLPYLVLGGFAGLRTSEIERMSWEHINWTEKTILVGHENKTGRRFAPLLDNAAQWLAPFRAKKGKIINGFKLQLAQEGLAAAAEVTWKRNALRHSYASNRYRILHDVPRLAIEMGNSVGKIETNYHNLTSEPAAQEYFAIAPITAPALPVGKAKMPKSKTD